jgi:hypothetical protein
VQVLHIKFPQLRNQSILNLWGLELAMLSSETNNRNNATDCFCRSYVQSSFYCECVKICAPNFSVKNTKTYWRKKSICLYCDHGVHIAAYTTLELGTSSIVVGWGTIPQFGRSLVRWGHWPYSFSRTMALGSSKPLSGISTRNLPGSKGLPARKAENLTVICEPIV